MEQVEGPDGDSLYVATDEGDRGSIAPFYVAYRDPDRERRYGWRCGNCGSFDTAMDTMGRIACGECGNRRKPTEWDAAHE